MIDALRDPTLWQILAVIVALVTIWVMYRIANGPTHGIGFEDELTPLLSVHTDIAGRLQVKLDDRIVENPSLIRVRIVNTGRHSIRPEDFTVPLTVSLGREAEILSVEVEEVAPSDLGVRLSYPSPDPGLAPFQLQIEPLLLNYRDEFSLKMLAAGTIGSLHVSGRIESPRVPPENSVS